MPQVEIVCPSGLSGTVRGLRGSEIDLFANADAVRNNRVTDRILAACWVETSSFGPVYQGMERMAWDEALICDRFYAIMAIRKATRNSSEYSAKIRCTGSTGCGNTFPADFDLDALDVYDLPDDSVNSLAAGVNEFTYTMDRGDVVTHRLLRAKDEHAIEKTKNMTPAELATTSMASRILRVEATDGEGKAKTITGAELRRWIRELEFSEWQEIRKALEEVDGGIDMAVEVTCPKCGNHMGEDGDFDLPLDPAEFWGTQKRARSSKRKVRAKSRG